MKHSKEVVIDVLSQYVNLSIEFINEVVISKLDGLLPKNLRDELYTRIMAAAGQSREEMEDLYQRYLNEEDMTFTDFVRECNEKAVASNVRGQVIAQRFSNEHAEEIIEFQAQNADVIEAKLKELGLDVDVEVTSVETIPDINTSGGQA